ncbi:MAG: hypothetical protein WBP12_02160 [Candidatus Saccharimonas sp.]
MELSRSTDEPYTELTEELTFLDPMHDYIVAAADRANQAPDTHSDRASHFGRLVAKLIGK